MKIKCTHCGRKFDYDLYAGLCPHCGVYQRQGSSAYNSSEAQAQGTSSYSSSEAHTQPKTQPMASHRETATKSTSGKRRNNWLATAILIVILGFIIAGPEVFHTYQTNKIAKTLTLSEPVTPTKVKPSKGFTVSTENGDFTVTFSSRSIDNDSTFETPEGYEILTVKYHVTVPQKALDTFPGQADENHKPISNYDLSRVKHLEYSELEDNGTTDNIDSQNGTLSFLIKKNDFKGLLINELDPDTEVLANSYLVIGIPKQKK